MAQTANKKSIKEENVILERDLLTGLTEAQREAVTHMDGPMLVLAGPGSGKTRVITHRIAYLISRGIRPQNILAITFTNKAAEEMRQRLRALQVPRGSTICTFHSLAARLLRTYADCAGLSADFSIYDESDQRAAMREALKQCALDIQNYPPVKMLARISRYKNNIRSPEQVAADETDFRGKIAARVYRAYQDLLSANAALDFDDLLMKLALLLRDDSQLRDRLNDRYRYVLVDEYQDTNHGQYQIARGLTLNHSNLFATGDPDQSIYGWRGADIGNILAFEEDYSHVRVVRLEENFRSTPEVLDLADQVIRGNQRRKEKRLFTSKPSGSACELFAFPNEYDEARGLVQWVRNRRREGLQYRDLAVFYRVNSMSRVLEEALRREYIPYQIIRGVEFFHRREIKDMLAYLRVLVNPSDQISLKRIINQPTRGIGSTTINRLFAYCQGANQDIWQVMTDVDQVPALNNAAKTKVKNFVHLIVNLQARLDSSVARTMKITYQQTGLSAAHTAEKTDDAANNVKELVNSAVMYDTEAEKPFLADYLQQIALISDADGYDKEAGSVSLMTLHAAKGLEFPAVLIVGLEEGLIPHSRNSYNHEDLEEERRLLFVGLTRAQDKLSLSYARHRTAQGAAKAAILSAFLRGLTGLEYYHSEPDDTCDVHNDFYQTHDSDETMEDTAGFVRGQLVRHPTLGLGRIDQVTPSRDNPKVVVQFNSGRRKTLYLKYAKLENIDYFD